MLPARVRRPHQPRLARRPRRQRSIALALGSGALVAALALQLASPATGARPAGLAVGDLAAPGGAVALDAGSVLSLAGPLDARGQDPAAGLLPPRAMRPNDFDGPRSAGPEALRGYVWPLHHARVMTWFAPTDDGAVMIDGRRTHDGIDLATFCGDTVRAAHGGRVVYAGRLFDPYLGYGGSLDPFYAALRAKHLPSTALPIVIVIDDGNGYRSVYAHLALATALAGDEVHAGDSIGREGMTGHATGCHLHYGLIRMDGPFVAMAPSLVARWHYPAWVRARVDPLLVLDPYAPDAPRTVPGISPPEVSPGGPSRATILAEWRARDARASTPADRRGAE